MGITKNLILRLKWHFFADLYDTWGLERTSDTVFHWLSPSFGGQSTEDCPCHLISPVFGNMQLIPSWKKDVSTDCQDLDDPWLRRDWSNVKKSDEKKSDEELIRRETDPTKPESDKSFTWIRRKNFEQKFISTRLSSKVWRLYTNYCKYIYTFQAKTFVRHSLG